MEKETDVKSRKKLIKPKVGISLVEIISIVCCLNIKTGRIWKRTGEGF
jgi:hypothetical protein